MYSVSVGPSPTATPAPTGVFATGSIDTTTLTPPGDYRYTYSVEYKKISNSLAFTERGQPVFVIKSEGQSGNARRRAELAIIDMYNPMPWGFGLVGCEGVFLEAAAQTRALNSAKDVYPLDPIPKKYAFANAGHILTLGSNYNVQDGKKVRGNVDVAGGLVRGNIISAGTVKLASGTVRGYINAEDLVTVDGNTVVEGSIWGRAITGTAKWAGKSTVTPLPVGETEEACDPLDVAQLVKDRITGSQGSNNSNNDLPTKYFNRNTAVLNASERNTSPATIQLGVTGQEKTYYLSSATVGDNITLQVSGTVNLVMGTLGAGSVPTGGDLTMTSKSARLNIDSGASLRIYTGGGVYLDQAPFNYADNTARPTSLIIYSSVVNDPVGAGVPSVNNAKVQLAAPNTLFRGLVYAPYAYIRVKSNNSLYGSLRGRWIRLESNTAFTYDQAAASIDATYQGYRVAYWAEQPYDTYGN